MLLSVRFYKRLFLCLLIALIVIPAGLAIRFGVAASQLKQENERLVAALAAIDSPSAPTSPDPSAPPDVSDPPGESEPPPDVPPSPSPDASPSPSPAAPAASGYAALYPELYCSSYDPTRWITKTDTIYLTFDDGPSGNTTAILDILDEYGIKAAFFVTGRGDNSSFDNMREIVERGHTIGIHSYTHDMNYIYTSVEHYLDDFALLYDLIYEATDIKPEIFRFPGGSVNSYNTNVYRDIITELTRRGFTYYDWNVTAADTAADATEATVLSSVLGGLEGKQRAIVLMHEDKRHTKQALPNLLDELIARGYSFGQLTAQVKPIIFSYS